MKERNGRDLCRYIAVLLVIAAMICSLAGCTTAEGRPDEASEVSEAGGEPTELEESIGTEDTEEPSETEDSLAEDSTELELGGSFSEGAWQDAYAAFLRENDVITDDYWTYETMGFTLYDMDNNGTPELFVDVIDLGARSYTNIYTYANGLVNSGSIYGSGVSGVAISSNPEYQGIFHETHGFGIEDLHIYYNELENGQLRETAVSVSEYTVDESIAQYSFTVRDMYDQKLYSEWEESIDLEFHDNNEINIQKYIYGITVSSEPHPYATALHDFFMDAKARTAAYLADVDGDGINEMLAVKYREDGMGTDYRFFYITNGNLNSYDESWFDGSMFFSSNNHLVSSYGDLSESFIHLFTAGELEPNAVTLFGSPYGDGDDYTFNGKPISEGQYEAYSRQYGLGSYVERADETAKILAMTD